MPTSAQMLRRVSLGRRFSTARPTQSPTDSLLFSFTQTSDRFDQNGRQSQIKCSLSQSGISRTKFAHWQVAFTPSRGLSFGNKRLSSEFSTSNKNASSHLTVANNTNTARQKHEGKDAPKDIFSDRFKMERHMSREETMPPLNKILVSQHSLPNRETQTNETAPQTIDKMPEKPESLCPELATPTTPVSKAVEIHAFDTVTKNIVPDNNGTDHTATNTESETSFSLSTSPIGKTQSTSSESPKTAGDKSEQQSERLLGEFDAENLRVVASSSALSSSSFAALSSNSSSENVKSAEPAIPPTPVINEEQQSAYHVFRDMAPYIAVHFDSTVVIHVPGDVLESKLCDSTLHDIVLLKTLGVKLVLVAGCRPQIKRRLLQFNVPSVFVDGMRVCDQETLRHCQSVAGSVRVEIESKLGRGLMNAPSFNGVGAVQVISGNFVKAIPYGVRGGVDFKYTGVVQRIAAKKIHSLLSSGDIVLLSHIGYSPSAEVFHCRSEEVAVKTAAQLKADKLIFLHNGETVVDVSKIRPTLFTSNSQVKFSRSKTRVNDAAVVHNLSLKVAKSFSSKLREEFSSEEYRNKIRRLEWDPLTEWKAQFLEYLLGGISAAENGVRRVHLVPRHVPGGLITELCTRDGLGLMISHELYDGVRRATPKDIPALLELVKPLEQQGILVTRPPQMFELEIHRFYVYERDGAVLAAFHYKIYEDRRYKRGAVEMSCVAVSPTLKSEGIGSALLSYCLRKALSDNVQNVFVLTTRSSHWFIDRGFKERPPESLPPEKYALYDFKRNPKVYFKILTDEHQLSQEELLWGAPHKI